MRESPRETGGREESGCELDVPVLVQSEAVLITLRSVNEMDKVLALDIKQS